MSKYYMEFLWPGENTALATAGMCGGDMQVNTYVLTMKDAQGQFHEVADDVAIRVCLRTH
eukprot:5174892-Karenia_brevis.AAC.1